MKVLERVIEGRLRKIVRIDSMQFVFMAGRSMTDASHTTEACKTIAAAILGSRLDYCNSLLAGTSVSNLARLQQLVQNTLARVVTEKSRFSFLPHHARSYSFALASCLPQNKFQDCYYHFQDSAVPVAILSRCPYSTVCADTIIAIFFFIVTMCS